MKYILIFILSFPLNAGMFISEAHLDKAVAGESYRRYTRKADCEKEQGAECFDSEGGLDVSELVNGKIQVNATKKAAKDAAKAAKAQARQDRKDRLVVCEGYTGNSIAVIRDCMKDLIN